MAASSEHIRNSGLPESAIKLRSIQVPRRFVREAWGGTETTILETSRALTASDNPAQVFTTLCLSNEEREKIGGVEVRRFAYGYPFFGLSLDEEADMDQKGGNLLSFALLRALLREPGIDILHAHSSKRLGGIVRTAARMRKIPYVVSLHGGIFDVPAEESAALVAPIQGKTEWGKPFGMLLGSRRVLEDASAIVCVGRAEYEAASKLLPTKRIELLPNGVDSSRFATGDGQQFRRRNGIPLHANLLLCVSRIDSQKSQLSLIEAMPRILYSEPNSQLVLIGPVTRPDYLRQIQRRIRELGLTEVVHILPALTPDDPELVNAYHAADIFCLPSMHEPFGIVILEAWAAGCPVVASRVGGIPGFVCDGKDALLVKPGAIGELADRLTLVLQEREVAQMLSDEGRRRAQTEFDWAAVTKQLLGLYRELAQG